MCCSLVVCWKPSVRLTAVFALPALLLVPLVRISFYAVPWYDEGHAGLSRTLNAVKITRAVMLAIFSVSPNQAGNYSSFGAYYYVHAGEAYNFYQEYLKRVEIPKSSEPGRGELVWKILRCGEGYRGVSAWNRMLP